MYERVVVKVGTQVLSTGKGELDLRVLKGLVAQIAEARSSGVEVVLVSSGAVGAGRSSLRPAHPRATENKQVLAAVGQVRLMGAYAEAFAAHGELCAQVLATKEDFRDKRHYLNMRTCFEQLLASGVVPVVNENDVVATTELLFTDNDELAGLVASQIDADAVIIFTSVEGLLAGDPRDPRAEVVPEVTLAELASRQKHVAPSKTAFGRGGMLTKFAVAKKLMTQGIAVHLARGTRARVLRDILEGKGTGTRFVPERRSSAHKRRLAYSEGLSKGAIIVNAGAEALLRSNERVMSVLPIGVVGVVGQFEKGDIIEVLGADKRPLGFGVAQYSAARARELKGVKRARPVIHYDHLFIGG